MNKPFTPSQTADPVDIHVGARVRMLRKSQHMSQESLAGKLHLTFQQVQKYERGHNRISCSKLFAIAGILGVGPAFFFEGLEQIGDGAVVGDPLADGAIRSALMDPVLRSLVHGAAKLNARQVNAVLGVVHTMNWTQP